MEPADITERKFVVGLRGYDREEVDGFLREVAGEVAALRSALQTAETELTALRGALEHDLPRLAGNHVAAILRTAEAEAHRILHDARKDRETIDLRAADSRPHRRRSSR